MSHQCLDYSIEKTVNLLKDAHVEPPFDIDTKIPYECKDGYILGNQKKHAVFTLSIAE